MLYYFFYICIFINFFSFSFLGSSFHYFILTWLRINAKQYVYLFLFPDFFLWSITPFHPFIITICFPYTFVYFQLSLYVWYRSSILFCLIVFLLCQNIIWFPNYIFVIWRIFFSNISIIFHYYSIKLLLS